MPHWDASAHDPKRVPVSPVKPPLTDHAAIRAFLAKRNAKKVMEYTVINILDLLETVGEEEIGSILSDFSCPAESLKLKNFLHNNAVEFAKKKMSITHLVFDDHAQLLAYFTLTHKPSYVEGDLLSKTRQKKTVYACPV